MCAISNVNDPILQNDIRTLGWVRSVELGDDPSSVVVNLHVPKLMPTYIDSIKDEVKAAASEAGAEVVEIRVTAATGTLRHPTTAFLDEEESTAK